MCLQPCYATSPACMLCYRPCCVCLSAGVRRTDCQARRWRRGAEAHGLPHAVRRAGAPHLRCQSVPCCPSGCPALCPACCLPCCLAQSECIRRILIHDLSRMVSHALSCMLSRYYDFPADSCSHHCQVPVRNACKCEGNTWITDDSQTTRLDTCTPLPDQCPV